MRRSRVGGFRQKARSFARIARVTGPRPIVLAQTLAFQATRGSRERRSDALYRAPLEAATVELRLPTIGLEAVGELPDELSIAAMLLREEADEIVSHRVDFLGSGLVELGEVIDWHRDFKSGYRWPGRFYRDVEVTRLHDSSDAKVPWELSRCHHLLTLARAARLFEEERYALELEAQLSSWIDQNPPGIGINWVNPMEVAIRAVNVVWAVATLEEWRPLERHIRERVVESLRWHGRHIRLNLEGSPYLRSNHYLSDLLGLLVLGAVLEGDPGASGWFRFARRGFEREIVKQVHGDGLSFEASLGYHGLAMEIFLVARRILASAGESFSPRFDQRLRRMAEVSRTVRHGNGRIPLFGDQDSGRILPGGFARPPTHDNLLWLAAATFDDRRPLDGPVDPEVAWTLGIEKWERCGELAAPLPVESAAFSDGGMYVLHSDRTHVVIRCGHVGQNGFGGHSHNDMLSYELSIDSVPLIVDSGTYAYTFDVDSRNVFRSTSAHNALVVDGEEISPFDPVRVFELRGFARPTVEVLKLDGDVLEFAASHDGYRRLRDPVVHRRRFALAASSGELSIRDEAVGGGTHLLQMFVHLAAGALPKRISREHYEIANEGTHSMLTWQMHLDETEVRSTWVSASYGTRENASVIVGILKAACPATVGYTLTPVPA